MDFNLECSDASPLPLPKGASKGAGNQERGMGNRERGHRREASSCERSEEDRTYSGITRALDIRADDLAEGVADVGDS